MATSASARGKLLEAARKGESIPENVALDADGKPTTDPEMALKGSILPFGGIRVRIILHDRDTCRAPLWGRLRSRG